MAKTLYFEGAGWADADISKATVGNCRIRTAFHNDEGKAIYLEILGSEVTKSSCDSAKLHAPYAGFIDFCFYILGDDDENKHSLGKRNNTIDYTIKGILDFVNSLGCSFDEVAVLPNLAGYRVFKENGKGYNYGDKFDYDAELTATRERVEAYYYEVEKAEGKEFPNFTLWVDENNPMLLHLLRHFNGYNKHWSIVLDNEGGWAATETHLGRYAC